jgi:hypothetical protein
MRKIRVAAAAITTMTLVGAVTSMGSARAGTTGVGTSEVSTTVLDVQLGTDGSVLGVRLLGDDARSSIDPKVAAGEAYSRLHAVSVSSDTVTALNKSSGLSESKQPGGDADVTTGSINLSQPATDVTVPAEVLSGTIGVANLASKVAPGQATSAIDATLTNAALAGGLVTAAGITSTVATEALAAQSAATRLVKADQVVLLDLGSLLAGLNIALTDLPLDAVTGLLDDLGVDVDGIGDAAAVHAAIDDLQTKLGALTAPGATVTTTTVTTIIDTVNGLGSGLGLGTVVDSGTVTTITTSTGVDQINLLIDELQGILGEVVDQVLTTLDNLALLKVSAVEVGVTTKAADTVANSTHGITAKIGGITVGGTTLPGVNIVDTLATINSTVATVNGTLGDALGSIHPDLGTLLDVAVFQRAAGHGVTTADGYTKAVDGITALSVKITPPAALASVLTTIAASTERLGDLLVLAGATVPNLNLPMKSLGTQTNTPTVGALGNGGTVTLASLGNTSNFAPQLAGTGTGTGTGTGSEGPRNVTAATGSDSTVPLTALAMLLIALGLGFREWVRMPAPRRTES